MKMTATESSAKNTAFESVALKPLQIGNITVNNPLLLAPMAGVSDYPFREIARQCGAGLCISEMLTSQTELWHTNKSSFRLPSEKDPEPRPVQIAGADPEPMAEAAKRLADMGAGIIDINMGCPAKKVCAKAAGSALLADEKLVAEILDAVVKAVDIPVTLKTRTGTDPDNKNAVRIARLAESIGVQALTLHGRTRACRFKGNAEYDTIAEVVAAVSIPVIANGDIDSPEKAFEVMLKTGAQGLMVGRGAWGKPWLFRQISERLEGKVPRQPSLNEIQSTVIAHIELVHAHYETDTCTGRGTGIGFARKHVDRYLEEFDRGGTFRKLFNQLDSAAAQIESLNTFFSTLGNQVPKAA